MLLQFDFLRDLIRPLTSGSYSFWVVLIEFILIGVPVYLTLRFLRGTRGARLVRAVGLILVVGFLLMRLVAEELNLDRISYLYPYFVLTVSLIALVVFQPELRRGLMRIGERGWFRSWGSGAREVIEAVVIAAGKLSKKKIGALIALERTTSLGGVADTGVRLNATVSAELLETIFWPGTALHDMGVIIQEDQIIAAGCQFPLSDSEDVDRSLGSRHRAAVGMSHECDAVVIVISEETGTISVAERGRLRRSLTPDSLRDLLLEAFSGIPEELPKPAKIKPKPKPKPPMAEKSEGPRPAGTATPLAEAKKSA
jgi:diadenylate cyclase